LTPLGPRPDQDTPGTAVPGKLPGKDMDKSLVVVLLSREIE